MKVLNLPISIFLLMLGSISVADEPAEITPGEKLFALKVKPLLAEKCLACHGNDREKLESGLDLTSRAGMLKGGDVSNQVLVPNNAAKSPLRRDHLGRPELRDAPQGE